MASAWWGFGGGGGEQLVGEGDLVALGPVQEPVGGGLAGASDSAAPEAAELGSMDCVAGHGYVDHVGAD